MNTRFNLPLNASRARGRLAQLSAALFTAGILAVPHAPALAGTLGVFTSDDKGFDTHTFYYDDGQEVVIIDTQFVPALTQKMVEQIRSTTRSPITRVVVTHPNPDKFNGLAWLHGQGVRSISSRAVADDIPAVHAYKTRFWVDTMKAFKPADYPKLENVQETFEGQSTQIRLKSGETLTLFALKNPGVASHQVVVRIDATGDLIVGDLVHHKAHAWLEGGLKGDRPAPSIQGWMAALDELPQLSAGHEGAKVYGGRGEFTRVQDAVNAQKAYLAGVDKVTRNYLASAQRCSTEGDSTQKADARNTELTQRISAAFPEYKLPYMVRYSVYGLAGELARQQCGSTERAASSSPDLLSKAVPVEPAKVRIEHEFAQNADVVWQRLGRFCGITEWQSLVASCLVEERKDGFYRVVVMKDNSAYTERLEHFSHPERAFQYAIVSGPLPVTGYVSRLQILPVDEQRATLVWQAWYDQPRHAAATVASNLEALYRNGIRGMDALLDAAH